MTERRLPVAPHVDTEDVGEAAEATIAQLSERLRQVPEDRVVERGVLKYNLGLAYAEAPTGNREIRLSRAVANLEAAARLFEGADRPIEHARARNALGASLRELGEPERALEAFRVAADLITARVSPGEHGAAMNNLGLALADMGRYEEAIEAYEGALEDFAGEEFVRQRISALHNLGQALASIGETDRVRAGIERYEEAAELADPEEQPYQWALVQHSLGVALTAVEEPERAVDAFRQALRVFTRHRFPFQFALAKNNLGLACAQIGDVQWLRRAVVAYEDSIRMLDVRMHREQWEQVYRNLELAETALADAGEEGTRPQHFVRLLASVPGDELEALVRERVTELFNLPEPRRTDGFVELERAMIELPEDDVQRITAAWLNVLMELPNEALHAGLAARMQVHDSLEGDELERAREIMDRTIREELLAPQRIRVRDTLYEMGYERPGQG